MLKTEKEARGSFWAAYYNIAANNVLTIIEHAGKGCPQQGDRFDQEIGKQSFDIGQDTSTQDDRSRVHSSAAVATLLGKGGRQNLTAQRRVMKSIAKALPLMARIWRRTENGVSKNGSTVKEPQELTPQEFGRILLSYVDYLFNLRNYFTHFEHDPVSMGDMDPTYLGIIFDSNIGTAKERFYSGDKVERNGKLIPDDKRVNNFRRYKGVETVVEDDKPKKLPKANPDFKFYFWERGTNHQSRTTGQTSGKTSGNNSGEKPAADPFRELTPQGLAFFVCLFLEKKYANMLLDSIGIKDRVNGLVEQFDYGTVTSDTLTLMKRVFTITCARLPRARIESESLMTNQVLGLDILSTLHKCPRQLFELLSAKDQDLFRTESENGQEVLMRRFENRFPYLAMNFIDRKGNFGNLRFCVDMGNYYFRCHPRTQIDGCRVEDRRLKKKITCFTKIQDAIEFYQQERVREGSLYHIATQEGAPPASYRLDMLPQYAVRDNRIGIAMKNINGGGNRALFSQPEIPVDQPWGKDRPKTFQPDAWLPTHELMPILFLACRENGAKAVESAIREHVSLWHRFLDQLSAMTPSQLEALCWNRRTETREQFGRSFRQRFNLELRDIPDEISYYLLNGKIKAVYLQSIDAHRAQERSQDEAAELWRQKQRERTEIMIERFKRESNYDFKLGKGKQPRYTSGYIAGWLVKDFMRLQMSNGSAPDRFGKLKSSPDYMALQSALACFDSQRDSIRELFVQARLIDGLNFDHPFLKAVLADKRNVSSLKTFFSAYLTKRLEWLKSQAGKKAYPLRRLYRRGQVKQEVDSKQMSVDQYFRSFVDRIKRNPVCLPRGLFNSQVRDVLRLEFPEQFARQVPDGQRANFTWLMLKYLEWSGDQQQWFYRKLKAGMDASQFKSLFALVGTTEIRNDAEGIARLNKKLKASESARRSDIKKLMLNDPKYKKLVGTAFQDAISERMAESEQSLRRKLVQLQEVWKEIRMVGVEDIILRDVIWQLLDLPQAEIRLKDIMPEHDLKAQREERMNNPEKVIAGQLKKESILNRTVDLVNVVKLPGSEGTIKLTGKMKRKNFGNFFRMLSDPRITSFFRLYKLMGFESVDYDYLELIEFEQYDRVYRPQIFELVHKLEKTVLAKYPDVRNSDKGYVPFERIAGRASGGDEFVEIQLNMYRNAFAHQYYPEYCCQATWSDEEKARLEPKLQAEITELQRFYSMERRLPNCKTPLVKLVFEAAQKLFNDAINNVKLS